MNYLRNDGESTTEDAVWKNMQRSYPTSSPALVFYESEIKAPTYLKPYYDKWYNNFLFKINTFFIIYDCFPCHPCMVFRSSNRCCRPLMLLGYMYGSQYVAISSYLGSFSIPQAAIPILRSSWFVAIAS
jgi:hypothetical protein